MRLVDQAVTMQAALRDRYSALSRSAQCTILCGSAVGLAFAFARGDSEVTLLGATARGATWLGWFAVLTFVLTLVELIVDLRGKAHERNAAVRALATLKKEYRDADLDDASAGALLNARYAAVTDAVPPIPERSFLRLKAAHLRKIEVSKILSSRPGIGPLRARWILWTRKAPAD